MAGIIVITGLGQFAPTERWPRLIDPLAVHLEASGLGELLERSTLNDQFIRCGSIDATEISVRLVNLDYGRELVGSILQSAGLRRCEIIRPEMWRSFQCDDYFASEYIEHGYWDEPGQYWSLEPIDKLFENEEAEFLDVGGAGTDGIRFGYRRGHSGFWAYPVGGEYVFLADTVASFRQGWISGSISL